ncbi:glycosyltransferase family 4 protein [Methylobacter marinus]|jgi:glycosyltransferase involved in cell wall biosynthesis|uniref:glycosyltransferase family 4 protein n=1 Tax=Methylobacter marinus TaxID=34058 RepID=UPI00035D90B0|nr:glycosyltransferase family 4 protein [Methylobacter marinus]
MKVLLIIDDYLPDSIKVGAKMMHELAVEFVARGNQVTVITPDHRIGKRAETTVLDGVTVCRFRSGEIKNVAKVKRAVNETLLSYNAWRAYKNHFNNNRHDLIVYYSPTIFWGSLVRKLKKNWGAPSYLILRDFFPQWVIDNGILSARSPITKYFRFFEWLNYQAADTIAIQSPGNKTWFARTTQTGKPLEVLYNWAANEPVPSRGGHYREALGLKDKVVYFYGGNIGHAQDMMNIVRLAKNMRTETRAHFVLVGDGDEVGLVRSAMAREGLNNISLLPAVSQDEFKQMLAEFDVGLFTLHPGHSTHNFPGKLLGYMVQHMPILGSINPNNDLKPAIEEAGAGLITVNGDDEGLLNNALTLLHDETLRIQMGKNANRLLNEQFSVASAVDRITAFAVGHGVKTASNRAAIPEKPEPAPLHSGVLAKNG